ncbi:hypothetical protein K2Z83_24860, partial [Oscillochloris sp. ZM17-4]|nr:hypothetical protein [Oscillochloris sp. ZM17-4]
MPTAAPLPFAAFVITFVIAFVVALSHPSPQTIDVGAPGDAYFLANFYPAEADGDASVRWSAPGARLLLPAVYQGPVALTMRLHAAPFAPPQDRTLSLARSGQPMVAFGADTGWRIYHVLLPPGGSDGAAGGQTPLDLIIPSASPGPADPRPLGLVLDRADLRYLGPTPLGPPLMRALLITWALGVILAMLGRSSSDHERRAVARRSWSLLLRHYAVGVIGAGMALWAWRDPGGFAWAVPDPPLWLLRPYVAWVGVAIFGHLALLLPLPWRGLGALLVLGLPGWLAARALFPNEGDPLARAFLGLCGAVAVAPLLTLALHAIPGPLPAWLLLLSADILSATMI